MKLRNHISILSLSALATACSSGSSSNSTASVVQVATFDYQPGNKTAVMAAVGGGAPVVAEIDTGSQITAINESAVGPNLTATGQTLTMPYGAGENIVTGYIAYGQVKFTTTSGQSLSTSSNTPILVVTQGSVDLGGGNNAILGMRMDNQLSSRLYLAYPYNQMMVLNRSQHLISFGKLNSSQLAQFAIIPQVSVICNNYQVTASSSNNCLSTPESAVSYNYSLTGGGTGSSNYPTVFDSGEATGHFYLEAIPTWMSVDGNGMITNQINVSLNTNHGSLPLPITPPLFYTAPLAKSGAVNPGNTYFNTYQILFDQANGVMGFLESNTTW